MVRPSGNAQEPGGEDTAIAVSTGQVMRVEDGDAGTLGRAQLMKVLEEAPYLR